MDRCALFVDAGYLLADGAMAVHGTRQRDAVSWDYARLLELVTKLAVERTQLPMLRCYWYEATTEGSRTPEHEALADISGLKLRLGRVRPGRREGVDLMAYRDLTKLAHEHSICDAVLVSGDEEMVHAVADIQDFGVRVTGIHVAVDGNWTISRTLRQECDDLIEIVDAQLRPYVNLLHGVDASSAALSNGRAPDGPLSQNLQTPSLGGHRIRQAEPGHTGPQPMPSTDPEKQEQPERQEKQGRHHTKSNAGSAPSVGPMYTPQHGGTDDATSSSERHPPTAPQPHQEDSPAERPQGLQSPHQPPPSRTAARESQPPYEHRPPSRSSRHRQPSEQAQPPQSAQPSRPPQPPEPGQSSQPPQPSEPARPPQPPQPPRAAQPPQTQRPAEPPQPPQPAQPAQPPRQEQEPPRQEQQPPSQEQQPPGAPTLSEAVQAAYGEGRSFGYSVARDAPALWLEAVLARKPRMPSDLEARLLQGSALPIDFLLHDEVRHALRRGFWEALENSRRL